MTNTNENRQKQTYLTKIAILVKILFMDVKSDYLTSLRDLPEGLKVFLETPLPTPPVVSQPTTEEEGNIVQGVLAYFILECFRPFGGFMPLKAILRVGSHSPVMEDILLTGLEYIGEQTQNFEIVEPVNGKAYAPGDIRIVVKGKGNIVAVTVTVDVNNKQFEVALTPDNAGKIFVGYARCEEIFEYVFTAKAEFNDDAGTTGTATATITIGDTGEEETQADLTEFEQAVKKINTEADGIIHKAFDWGVDYAKTAATDAAVAFALKQAGKLLLKILIAL